MRLIRVSTLREYASVVRSGLRDEIDPFADIPVFVQSRPQTLADLTAALDIPVVDLDVSHGPKAGASRGRLDTISAVEVYADYVRRCDQPLRRGCVAAYAGNHVWVAMVLAVATNRPLFVFDRWTEIHAHIAGGDGNATIVCPHETLTPSALAELARATVRSNIGVVTGRDLAATTFAVAKAIMYRDRRFDRSLMVMPHADLTGGSPRHRRIAIDDVDGATVSRLVSQPVDIFGVSTHGDNINSSFGKSILCGLTGTGLAGTRRHVHTCEADGLCRRDLNRQLTRLPFHQLRARFVALETCSAIGGADSIFPVAVSQAMAAIDGWADGFLSSVKVARDTHVGPLLVQAALMSGLSYGEASRLYSLLQVSFTGDQPSYLLLGDAEQQLASRDRPPVLDVAWPDGAAHLDVPLNSVDSRLLTLRIQHAPVPTADEAIELTLSTGGRTARALPVFAGLARDPVDNTLLVLVFATADLPALRLGLTLVEPRSTALQQEITVLEQNMTQLRWITDKVTRVEGLRPTDQLRSQAADLQAACGQAEQAMLLLRDIPTAVSHIATCNEVYSDTGSVKAARGLVRQVEQALVQAAPRWQLPHHIAPFYESYLDVEGPERLIGASNTANRRSMKCRWSRACGRTSDHGHPLPALCHHLRSSEHGPWTSPWLARPRRNPATE